jgi:hypothetical protein
MGTGLSRKGFFEEAGASVDQVEQNIYLISRLACGASE